MKVNVISEKQQEFNGTVYYLCGYYYQNKGKRLHREVWKYHNGEIPKGYHIHHKDRDRTNNQIENLAIISHSEHEKLHSHDEKRIEHEHKQIKMMQELAKAWHSSEEGKAWHSEHAKEAWKERQPKTYTCTNCGKKFTSLLIYGKDSNTFCCNNCKSAYRKKSGVDNVTRICAYCGKEFKVNKYSKAACCSRECAVKRRWNK